MFLSFFLSPFIHPSILAGDPRSIDSFSPPPARLARGQPGIMGRLFLVSLPATTGDIIYRCKHCDTHLAYATDIISKTFRCKHGKAYLFDNIVNVNVGEKEDRMMTTGLHSVCDIFCVSCGSILGWKYLVAFDKNQRYKEGKFILERCKVVGPPPPVPDAERAHLWIERDQSEEEDDQDATM